MKQGSRDQINTNLSDRATFNPMAVHMGGFKRMGGAPRMGCGCDLLAPMGGAPKLGDGARVVVETRRDRVHEEEDAEKLMGLRLGSGHTSAGLGNYACANAARPMGKFG